MINKTKNKKGQSSWTLNFFFHKTLYWRRPKTGILRGFLGSRDWGKNLVQNSTDTLPMRNGLLVKKYQFFFLLTKLFSSNGTTCANSGPVHTYSLSFFSVLAYRPHVSSENGHRKRIFSKTLSWVEIFENAGFSLTRGRTKTKVFKCDDVIHHILLAWRMLRNWCHCIDIVRVDGRKRFEYATQRCFFVFFLKRRKKF